MTWMKPREGELQGLCAGKLRTRWRGAAHYAAQLDIVAGAKLMIEESNNQDIRLAKWKPFPK